MATRGQKANAAKKQLVLKLKTEHPNMSQRELANLAGTNQSFVKRTLNQTRANDSVAQKTVTPVTSDSGQVTEPTGVVLDFEESPAPVKDEKNVFDKAWDNLKAAIGFEESPDKKKKTPAPRSVKLSEKKQQFVDSVTPSISLAFVVMAAYVWNRIGPQYKSLAPSEEVAQKIMEPLVRIYARHANFMTEINPDYTDAGASLFALWGYVSSSLQMYNYIKQQEANYEEANGYRAYRSGYSASDSRNGVSGQEAPGGENGRYADVSGSDRGDATGNSSNGQYTGTVNLAHLTPKQRSQYEKLSQLAAKDFEARARRSGQYRGFYP